MAFFICSVDFSINSQYNHFMSEGQIEFWGLMNAIRNRIVF